MHVLLVEAGREELDIATTTVNVLLMLHCELHHQCLVPVAERLKAGGDGVEPGILACLDPCGMWVCWGKATPSPRGPHPAQLSPSPLSFSASP